MASHLSIALATHTVHINSNVSNKLKRLEKNSYPIHGTPLNRVESGNQSTEWHFRKRSYRENTIRAVWALKIESFIMVLIISCGIY